MKRQAKQGKIVVVMRYYTSERRCIVLFRNLSPQNVEQSYIQPQQTHSTIEVALQLQGSWNKTEE